MSLCETERQKVYVYVYFADRWKQPAGEIYGIRLIERAIYRSLRYRYFDKDYCTPFCLIAKRLAIFIYLCRLRLRAGTGRSTRLIVDDFCVVLSRSCREGRAK